MGAIRYVLLAFEHEYHDNNPAKPWVWKAFLHAFPSEKSDEEVYQRLHEIFSSYDQCLYEVGRPSVMVDVSMKKSLLINIFTNGEVTVDKLYANDKVFLYSETCPNWHRGLVSELAVRKKLKDQSRYIWGSQIASLSAALLSRGCVEKYYKLPTHEMAWGKKDFFANMAKEAMSKAVC